MALPNVLAPGSKTRTAAAVVGTVPLAAATAIINPLAKAVNDINSSIANNPVNKALDATGGALANAFNKISGREAPRQEKEVATNIKDSTNILQEIKNILEAQAVATGAYQKKDLELKEEQDREEDRRLRSIDRDDPSVIKILQETEKDKKKEGFDPMMMSGFLKKGLALLLTGGIIYMFKDQIGQFVRDISLEYGEDPEDIKEMLPFISPNIDSSLFFKDFNFNDPLSGDFSFPVNTGILDLTPYKFNFDDEKALDNIDLNFNRDIVNSDNFGFNLDTFRSGLDKQYEKMIQPNYLDAIDFGLLGDQKSAYFDANGNFQIPGSTTFYNDMGDLFALNAAGNLLDSTFKVPSNVSYLNEGFKVNYGANRIDLRTNTNQFAGANQALKGNATLEDQVDAEKQNKANNKRRMNYKNFAKANMLVSGLLNGISLFQAEGSFKGQMDILDDITDQYDMIKDDPEAFALMMEMYPDLMELEPLLREMDEKIREDYNREVGKIFAGTLGAVGGGGAMRQLLNALSPLQKFKWLKRIFTIGTAAGAQELAQALYDEQVAELQQSKRPIPHKFDTTMEGYDQLNEYVGMIEQFGSAGIPGLTSIGSGAYELDYRTAAEGSDDAKFIKRFGFDPNNAVINLDTLELEKIEVPENSDVEIDASDANVEINGTDVKELTEEVSAAKELSMLNGNGSGSSNQIVAPTTTTVVTKNDTSYNVGNDSTNILGTQKAVV